ncbi:MAG: Uma2 family endonuclease [Gemmatimonadetes bacterium]|nr:Uma2 family endonuclease [Gemmatimonadota bacterium]
MSTREPVRRMTLEEFRRLPKEDGYRSELVRGRVVRSPGPGGRHGEVEANVVYLLKELVRRTGAGKVLSGGASYVLERRPDTVRGPDVSFLSRERVPAAGLPESWPDHAPDLAVEILSPSNRPGEIRERLTDFFRAGCREAWLLSPRRRTVAVHRSLDDVRVLSADAELTSALLPGFRCRVWEFFE